MKISAAVLAAAMGFAVACERPASAATASASDRAAMSVATANYLVKVKDDLLSHGGAEIGAAAIEGDWAIADFRSGDGSEHGQLLFKRGCGRWVMRIAMEGSSLDVDDLTSYGVPSDAARKLVSEIPQQRQVAYLAAQKPAGAGSCP